MAVGDCHGGPHGSRIVQPMAEPETPPGSTWSQGLNISQGGIDLVKSFELCRLHAFKPTPNDVWTIGWGRTRGVKEGDFCTQEQADQWLLEDLGDAENCVNKLVTVPMTQGEFDALVSFAYNLGCMALRGSTLLRKLNASDYDGAAEEFKKWNHQGKEVLAGLTKRRTAEQELFEA